jgi:hypothetical protein
MLTVHLSTFILVFNQLDAQNLFYNKFYFTPLHVSNKCAHHKEVKIALHSHWYRWPSRARAAGHVMHQQFNIQQLYALPTLYLCVL